MYQCVYVAVKKKQKLKWKIKASRKEYVKSNKYKAIVFLGAKDPKQQRRLRKVCKATFH